MEINSLSSDLRKIYKEETSLIFGFDFFCSRAEKKIVDLFNKGFWYMAPFGYDQNNIIGLRIMPERDLKSSPVLKYNKISNNATTFSPNIESTVVMGNLEFMNNYNVIKELVSDLDLISEKTIPFFKYLNKKDVLSFYKYYLESKIDQVFLAKAKDNYNKIYLDFWRHYNISDSEIKKNEIIQGMIEDENYLPSKIDEDYGIWTTMIFNILKQRATYIDDFEDKYRYLWIGAKQPLGIDNASMKLKNHIPSKQRVFATDVFYDYFNSESESFKSFFPTELKEHALFNATETVRIKGNDYNGEDHLIAALIMDEQYDDPIGAWNSLITASHFAGINNVQELILKYWEAAIKLASKREWNSIHEVLTQQYEFYNFYKDQV